MVTTVISNIIITFYPYFMILTGIIGVIFGIDRIFIKREIELEIIRWTSFIFGILTFFLPIVLIEFVDTSNSYVNYTLILLLVNGFALVSRPLEKRPKSFTLVTMLFMALVYLTWFLKVKNPIGIGFPVEYVVLGAGVLLIILFAISYFFEHVTDTYLHILGWAVIILSMVVLIMVWFQRSNLGGTQDIPIFIVAGFALIMGSLVFLLFLLGYLVDGLMDVLHFMIGWGYFVFFVSLLTLIQGLFILIFGNPYGLLKLFGLP